MANYDDNPFAGDSENPFAVSIYWGNEFQTEVALVVSLCMFDL